MNFDPAEEGMLAKMEAEVAKVRGPYEELSQQEQKLLAKDPPKPGISKNYLRIITV